MVFPVIGLAFGSGVASVANVRATEGMALTWRANIGAAY